MTRSIRWPPIVLVAILAGCSSSDDSAESTLGDVPAGSGVPGDAAGETPADTPVETSPDDVDGPDDPVAGTLLGARTIPTPASLDASVVARELDYVMEAVGGGVTTARAQLFEPVGPAPADGFPLVVWAHGTTGIANACTPSASFEDFGNPVAVGGLLDAGYAVLAPDYEGFGTPTIHPYYVRSSHAGSVIDAVSAVHAVDGASPSDGWAVVGHSQGGHVALATARAEGDPAYPLRAVAALAPGTDLVRFSDLAFEAIDLALAEGDLQEAAERTFYLNVYGAYVAHAAALVVPTFEPGNLFGERVAALIDEALDENVCGAYSASVADALDAHLSAGGTLETFGGLRRDWYLEPELADLLERERLGDEAQSAPLLIVQGDADRQVPLAATTAFVDEQRAVGTDVTYEIIEGGRHGDVGYAEFGRTLAWLAERFPAR